MDDGGLLEPDERSHLAAQLARLNENIERQFQLIEQQRRAESDADRRANRRRWAIVGLVASLILVGNIRLEMLRAEQRRHDREQLAEILRAQCERSNLARGEIRAAVDGAFAAVVSVAPDDAKSAARAAGDRARADLAKALPVVDCDDPANTVEPTTPSSTSAATTSSTTPAGAPYASCDEARAAGATPLRPDDPGWNAQLDRDGDGVACE